MKGNREVIGIFIAVLIYAVIGALGVQFYLPSRNFNVEDITRDPAGNIYAAGETGTGVFVYQLDAGGSPQRLFRCKGEAREMQLFCQYEENRLYLAQMWYEDGKQWFSVWGKEALEKDFQRIWTKSIAEDVTLTDFQVREDRLYVTGVDQQTENILLYVWDGGEKNPVRYRTDFVPTTVYWGKDGMYTLSQHNQIYFITVEGVLERRDLGEVVFFLADRSGLYYQVKDSVDITYLPEEGVGFYTFIETGAVWNIQYSESAQNTALLRAGEGGRDELLILTWDGEDHANGRKVDCTTLGLREKLKCTGFPFLIYTLASVSVWIVWELFWHLVWKCRRLLYQTMAVLAALTGIWLVATSAGVRAHEMEEERQQQMFLADTCMDVQKKELLENIKSVQGTVAYEAFGGSRQWESVQETFAGSTMGNASQSFYVREELVCMDGNELVFLFAEEAPYGRRADTFYDALALEKIRGCILELTEEYKFIDKVNGISYAMAFSKVEIGGKPVCMVSRVPLYGMDTHHEVDAGFYIAAFAGWLLAMIAIAFFLGKKWKNIGLLCTAMDRVSRGEYAVDSRRAPDNEFGLMWLGLERMCRNLQLQKYRTDETLDYLDQYAPQNFECLFGKEKLQDIAVGETVQMAATLGMISVIDKDTLLTGKLQGQYVQYVNKLMELLFSQQESGKAVFLQDGSNLENVKVIFQGETQSARTAVRYSIDCMEELLAETEDAYDTNPFILLHTDQFRCGLAGGSKQVYPYVTSMEMDTLSRYIDELKRSGARVVVTEQTWQQVQVQGRRIGYVASPDGDRIFWLYEILDACPQMQKLGKLKNNELFAKALELYYADDLYPARSAFTEVVRECPEDGIARWYVFACDGRLNCLNKEGAVDGHHELFWRSF